MGHLSAWAAWTRALLRAGVVGMLAAGGLAVPGARAADAGRLEISGRVCARDGGAPIPGAQVAGAGQSTVGDASGSYQITLAPARRLYLRASARGYQSTDLITVSGAHGGVLAGSARFSFCDSLALADAFNAADGSVRLEQVDQLQPVWAHDITIRGTSRAALEDDAAMEVPDGSVVTIPIRHHGTAIEATVPLRAGPGSYLLEINAAAGFALIKLPLFAGPYRAPAPPPPYQADPGGATIADLRAATLARLNAIRRAAGLAVLRSDPRLERAAQDHSDDLARHHTISHTGSDGSTPGQRVEATGVPFHQAGEDIGEGDSVQGVVLGLMDSPAHRGAILGDYRLVGIGVARTDRGLVGTIDFVR